MFDDRSGRNRRGNGKCSALLKERADYITEKDNNHDGIVEVIERFIL